MAQATFDLRFASNFELLLFQKFNSKSLIDVTALLEWRIKEAA